MTTIVDTYALQIIRDDISQPPPILDIASALVEAEENLTDLMPHGYRARITHWDEEDENDE